MRTYVINLAHSIERRAHISAQLDKAKVDYEIVSAVDGRNLDLSDANLIDPSLISRNLFPVGTAGCALSHLSVYRRIVEENVDVALVLEDDITLPDDIASLAASLSEHLTGAEVALLNYGSPEPCKISLQGAVELPCSRLLAMPVDVRQPMNAGAYVITREACLRMVNGLLPLHANADEWSIFYRTGLIDRVRCVFPLPVVKASRFESTIGLYSLGDGARSLLVKPLVRRKVPVLHRLILGRRERIMRQWERSEVVDAPFVEKPSRL